MHLLQRQKIPRYINTINWGYLEQNIMFFVSKIEYFVKKEEFCWLWLDPWETDKTYIFQNIISRFDKFKESQNYLSK